MEEIWKEIFSFQFKFQKACITYDNGNHILDKIISLFHYTVLSLLAMYKLWYYSYHSVLEKQAFVNHHHC